MKVEINYYPFKITHDNTIYRVYAKINGYRLTSVTKFESAEGAKDFINEIKGASKEFTGDGADVFKIFELYAGLSLEEKQKIYDQIKEEFENENL